MIHYNINGFNCNVLYNHYNQRNNAYIGIVVNHNNAPESKEIFHFIEHTLISTWYTKYCNYQNISISAKTSVECTQYIISLPKSRSRFLLSIELANSIIQGYFVSRNDCQKIKADIIFEYNMVLNQAPFKIEQEMLYKICGLLSTPIGTSESIQAIEHNDILDCFKKYYTPHNIQILVLGIPTQWKSYLRHFGSNLAHIKILGKRKNNHPFYSLFDLDKDTNKIAEFYKKPQYDSYDFTYFNYFQEFEDTTKENVFINLYLLVIEEVVLEKLNVGFEDIIFDVVEVTLNKKVIRLAKKKTVPINFEKICSILKNIEFYKKSVQSALSSAIQITKNQLRSCFEFSETQMQVYLDALATGYPPYNATDLLRLLNNTPNKIWEVAIYDSSKKFFKFQDR